LSRRITGGIPPARRCWFFGGFAKLGRYDVTVPRRLDDHMVTNLHVAANASRQS
jgi:hypothetical protein